MQNKNDEGGALSPRFRHATCGGEIREQITQRCLGCGAEGDIRPVVDEDGELILELVHRGTYLEACATFALFDGEPDPNA